MSEWIEGVLKHSETELKLLGLDPTPLGPDITTFIKQLHGTLHTHPEHIQSLLPQVGDLLDKTPLAPITYNDVVDDRYARQQYLYTSRETDDNY